MTTTLNVSAAPIQPFAIGGNALQMGSINMQELSGRRVLNRLTRRWALPGRHRENHRLHAARKYAGNCIDVVRAFNGSSGTSDAYQAGLMTKNPCCYPSAKGQQRMAQLLYRLGLGPLHG